MPLADCVLAHRMHRHAATEGQGCASLWTPNGAIHAFLAGAGPRAEGLDLGVPLTGRFSPFGGITGLSPVAMSMIDLASWLGSLGRLGWLVIPAFCLDVQ